MTIVPSLPRVNCKNDDAVRTRRTVLLCRRWVDNVRDVAKRSDDGRIIVLFLAQGRLSVFFFMLRAEYEKAGRKGGLRIWSPYFRSLILAIVLSPIEIFVHQIFRIFGSYEKIFVRAPHLSIALALDR